MKLGIVGLPNVGKSTLFNSLTKAGAAAANYPFCTIEPNVGVVTVPDKRIDRLTEMYNSVSTIYAVIEFVDIAGLVRGASKGEGLGNKFLSHIREVDAIVHVTRCFEDADVIHVDGKIAPLSDIETINIELILADMEVLERRIAKQAKNAKENAAELDVLRKIKEALNAGQMGVELTDDEKGLISTLELLTLKPVIYAANVGENELEGNSYTAAVADYAEKNGSKSFVICAKLEEELAGLPDEEKKAFLEELGLHESGLDKIIAESYALLGLISFLTAGPKETRAWTIRNGAKAPEAAGKVHSDFEKKFIKAEIVAYDDLMRMGTYTAAKEAGLVRIEGRDYVMKDGDVTVFRANA